MEALTVLFPLEGLRASRTTRDSFRFPLGPRAMAGNPPFAAPGAVPHCSICGLQFPGCRAAANLRLFFIPSRKDCSLAKARGS